jgi:hypothetical protein
MAQVWIKAADFEHVDAATFDALGLEHRQAGFMVGDHVETWVVARGPWTALGRRLP